MIIFRHGLASPTTWSDAIKELQVEVAEGSWPHIQAYKETLIIADEWASTPDQLYLSINPLTKQCRKRLLVYYPYPTQLSIRAVDSSEALLQKLDLIDYSLQLDRPLNVLAEEPIAVLEEAAKPNCFSWHDMPSAFASWLTKAVVDLKCEGTEWKKVRTTFSKYKSDYIHRTKTPLPTATYKYYEDKDILRVKA